MTVDDLRQMLQCSRSRVYKLVREKRIPYYHLEKCVRFSPGEIQEWLEGKRNGEYRIETSRGKPHGRRKKQGAEDRPRAGPDGSALPENSRAPVPGARLG
jgi:excisionase family DNA binding protein